MRSSKKAQGMPMNVIVIAVLVLIVLVILAVVLTGKFRIFATTTRNCAAQGGACTAEGTGDDEVEVSAGLIVTCPNNGVYLRGTNCEEDKDKDGEPDNGYCCIPLT